MTGNSFQKISDTVEFSSLSTRSRITDCHCGYPFIRGNPAVERADGNVCAVSPQDNVEQSESPIRINCQDKNVMKSVMRTNSFYAKLFAVKSATQNKGKRTAGIDGAKWTTPNSKMNAALKLSDKSYKAKPLRRVYIPKPGSTKKRPLSIPTMYDRAMQALHALSLSPVAEATADLRSFGFGKYRNAQDAAQYAFICLSGKNSAKWVLEGDIKGCFDNINHEWLLDNILMDKSILKQFLKGCDSCTIDI